MQIKITLLFLALSLTACQNIPKPDQTIPIEKSSTIVKMGYIEVGKQIGISLGHIKAVRQPQD